MDVVSGNDDVLKLRYGRNVNEKKEIAQKALSFVEPAKTILWIQAVRLQCWHMF